jgi:RNA:NAD 2'-phosphotransferase (TPT1/KptA family)/8-oxo-dGTP pyrophosphatase MutT (NUDIX family)/ribosomal protein L32
VRWYHGTSKQNAEKILKEGVLKPGEHSVYREDVPRYDAVYLTSDWQIAKYYSEERGKDGVVLEITADESKLMPDEDSIYDALHEGAVSMGGKANKKLGQAIRAEWFKYWKSIDGEGDTFEEAWEAWGGIEAEGSSGIAEEMKALTEEIHEKNPALSKAIIKASGKAAHIGPAKVVGVAKTAAKKVKVVKTPGFVIEVPQERRQKFFIRPKAPLEYWAFKNRPRVFINEPLIFTFNGKPVAKAVVVRVEAPGKGEGEYKHWHKVYWKPTTFRKFKGATIKLYHGSRVKFKPGDILTPQPSGYVNAPDVAIIEGVMEKSRPEGALPRKDSVYMVARPDDVDRAGGYDDYIYEVQPVGKVERGDLGWYGDVSVYGEHQPDDPEVIQAAKNYWAGEPHDKFRLWEYRAPKVKIVRLVRKTAALLKSAKVKLPTFEQVVDKKTDTNNEFDLGSGSSGYEAGVADIWEDRNLSNMKEYYDEILPKLQALKFPLTVYRTFAMRFKGEKIDYKNLGLSWSLNSRAAYLTVHEMFNDEEYEEYKTVTGKIASPDAVDWLNTVRAWMTLPEEQEIRMKPGATVKVQGKARTAAEDPDYYMTEGCGIYAVDFARKNGGEIYILSAERGEEWSEEIPYEVTHAFVKKDGKTFDVRGERTPDKMAWELSMGEYSVKGPWTPDAFEAKFMGDTDDKPLFGNTAAKIATNKKFYHGTKKKNLDAIMKEGLKVDKSEAHTEWHHAIYLACDVYTAKNYEGMHGGGEPWVIFEIDGRKLNENYMRPDDYDFPDIWDQEGREENWAHQTWQTSLKMSCQIAYLADIPPTAIKVYQGKTNFAALGDQHHHADDIPTPLRTVPNRPAVIDWYSDSSDVAGAEPEIVDIDPKTLLTDQATVSKSHLDKILANIGKINEPTPSTSEEHSAHPLVLGTSEGDFIFDGNHRCAAALLKGLTIKVLYLDLTPIEDWVPEHYLGEEDESAKSAAAKLPKGWRVTLKKENGFYWGHIWRDNQFYGTCGIGSEYQDKAREAAIDWAWTASGQPRPKIAAEDTQTFYHGTTWEAAKDINKTGIKANKWKFGPGKFVWVTIHPGQAYEYGQSISWHELDQPERSAVVEFEWPYKESEPDPEHEPHGDMYRRIPSDIPRSAVRKIQWFEKGKIVKTADLKTADHVNDEGYWAGEGNAASGVLPVCPQKGTVCLAWRSADVMSPNCWGTIGGAVQKGKSPQQSAKAEMAEEMGYRGGITLIPAYVFTDRGFSYHNFIGVVSNEFSFNPGEGFGWETDHITWVPYQEVLEDMKANSGDYHPGVLKLFANSKDIIERALKIEKKQASSKIAWQEIVIEEKDPKAKDPLKGNLLGGILQSNADLKAWADHELDLPPKRERQRRDFVKKFYGKKMAVIDDMRVFDRNKGWGTKIVNQFIEKAKAAGCDGVILQAGIYEDQQKGFDLVQWYERMGFKTVGRSGELPLMVKWLKPQGKTSAEGEEIIKSVTPQIERSKFIDEDEWQRINKWLISLQWRGRNPWYPEKFPWFAIRLFSDMWVASNDMAKEQLAEGKDLASLKQYLSEFAKEYGTSLEGLRSPKTIDMQTNAIVKSSSHSPACKCEMCSSIPTWKRPWLTGKCHEFALALSSLMPDAQFVAIGGVMFEHVGLRKGDTYYDVRGAMTKDQFTELFGSNANSVRDVSLEEVMKDSFPSYIGHEDELVKTSDFKSALRVVRRTFSNKTAEVSPTAPPPDSSRLPCPSGKRKYYDERSAIGPHQQWRAGTPMLRAYQCPKCGWYHLTSKPQRQPVTAAKAGRYYHVSSVFNRSAIEKQGLIPQIKEFTHVPRPAGVYVFSSFEDAANWAYDYWHEFAAGMDELDIWEVKIDPKKLKPDTHGQVENGFYSVESVPPQDIKLVDTLLEDGGLHTAATHTPEYAQQLIETLKQTVHEADFKVIGSVGAGSTSENDLDIMVDIHPDAVFEDDKAWIETSGLIGAMKLMGFDNIDTSDFSPEESAEKSETSGKYLDPQGSSIEKFFNPTTHHTVEFWFAESGMEKEADWKSKYVLPTALALTGLGVGAPPVHPGKATPQQIEQKQEEQEAQEAEQVKQPLDPADVTAALRTASRATGIPLAVLSAIAHNETSYGLDVSQGGSGSNGFMQMTPDALTEVNKVYGTDYIIEDMDDPDTAALAAAQYLHILLRKFDKNLDATIAAYNTGPAHINKVLADYGEVTPETLAAAGHQLTSTYLQKAKARMAPKTGAKQAGSEFPTQTTPQPSTTEHSDVMYHYAGTENRASIQKHGLLGSKSSAIENAVFLDSKLTKEGKYTDTWEVNVKGLELEPDWTTDISDRDEWEGHTWWIFYGDIPSNRLKLVHAGRMATASWIKKAAGFVFKSFKTLWHVGTMNPKDKRDDSYEGAGLSVSVNPEEWQMIAKIGGDLWELTKPGNKFVNFHRLSKPQRKQIADWGIKNGYAQPANLWRHTWYDDEIDDERYSDYATKEEAEAELGGYGEGEKVEPVKGGLTATPKLSQKSKRGKIDPLEVLDLLVTAYAEDELDCDGVWWADDLDPDNLSAPRGVIFPTKLSSWKKRKVQTAAKSRTPRVLYHGTYTAYLPSILKEGLKQQPTNKTFDRSKNYVYLTDSPLVAEQWAFTGENPPGGDMTKTEVVAVDVSKLDKKRLHIDDNLTLPDECPDCGEDVVAGQDCSNCGHSFEAAPAWQYDGDIPPSAIKVASSKTAAEWKTLPVTDEWINRAKLFLKDKWAERHKELQREGVPTDLKGACKFASLFAQKLFGGKIMGNPNHQVVRHGMGFIDLTDQFNPSTFTHDKEFWMNPEHAESMKSVEPRVQEWVDEFMQLWWTEAFKARMAGGEDYHQNVGWLLPDGSFQPLMKGESHRQGALRIGISTDPENMAEAFDKGAVRVSGYQYTDLEFKSLSSSTMSLLLEFILQKRPNAKGITLDWFKPRRTEQKFLSVDDVVQWLETTGVSVMASEKKILSSTLFSSRK